MWVCLWGRSDRRKRKFQPNFFFPICSWVDSCPNNSSLWVFFFVKSGKFADFYVLLKFFLTKISVNKFFIVLIYVVLDALQEYHNDFRIPFRGNVGKNFKKWYLKKKNIFRFFYFYAKINYFFGKWSFLGRESRAK